MSTINEDGEVAEEIFIAWRHHLPTKTAREHRLESFRKWHRNHRAEDAAYQRRYQYGLSNEEYEDLLAKQNGVCAICQKVSKLYVDHDHITDAVRGLVCVHCNNKLTWIDRNRNTIIEYIGLEDA